MTTTHEELLFKLLENKNSIPHEKNSTFVKHLLENYKFNINARNKDGFTALMQACDDNASSEIIDLLLTHGADLSLTTDECRETALHIAVNKGCTASLKACLNYQEKEQLKHVINHQDHEGNTALILASYHVNPIAVSLLLHETMPLFKERYIRITFPDWFATGYLDSKRPTLAVTEKKPDKKIEEIQPSIIESVPTHLTLKTEETPKSIEKYQSKTYLETEQPTPHKEVKQLQELTQPQHAKFFKKAQNYVTYGSTKGYQPYRDLR